LTHDDQPVVATARAAGVTMMMVVVVLPYKNDYRIQTRAARRPGPGVTDTSGCRTVVVGGGGGDLDEDPTAPASSSNSNSSNSNDDDDDAVGDKNGCKIKARAAMRPGPGVTDPLGCKKVVVYVVVDDLDWDGPETGASRW
jgi:hypothetical protein